VVFYQDRKGEYRWTIYASNGRKIACSGEGFKSKAHCFGSWYSLNEYLGYGEMDPKQVFEWPGGPPGNAAFEDLIDES